MLWLIVDDTGDFHLYVSKSDRFVVFQLKFSSKKSEQITQPIGVWKRLCEFYCLCGQDRDVGKNQRGILALKVNRVLYYF